MSFSFRSARDLAAAYESGATDPLEVAERALEAALAIDRVELPLRTFIALDPEDVRAQATASRERWRRKEQRGPLDGVPVAVKDEFDVRGYPTTCGTAFLGKEPARVDSVAVARMRAAGATIFGKTNMHELGLGSTGANPFHGTARNPYDPTRDTGGSSSGSAACVAAGITPIALGTDTGGSLRIPGAHCGVAAIKPTYDRVPTTGLLYPYWSLTHAGPLASNAADLRHVLECLAGAELPAHATPAKLRIGICAPWWKNASPAVFGPVRAAVERLLADGHDEVAVDLPHLKHTLAVGYAALGVEGAVALEEHLLAGATMSAPARMTFDLARGISAISFVKAQRVRALIAHDFECAFENADVLITPTAPMPVPLYGNAPDHRAAVDAVPSEETVVFTMPLNLTGLPAVQVPCATDQFGMPIGLQVIAPHGSDLLALRVAEMIERNCVRSRPRIWFDLLH